MDCESTRGKVNCLWAVCYYLDGARIAQKTLSGLWDNPEDAIIDQLRVCGGKHKPDVNGCVRGSNGIVSWIVEIPTNTNIQWTLAVAGPNH